MTLDPQARMVLDFMPPGTLDVHNVDVAALRAGMEEGAAAAEPVAIGEVTDERFAGRDGDEIPVRIYRPLERSGRGAVVFYHGGGWALGSLTTHDNTVRMLANASGLTFIAVDYRLAPEHPFPAAPHDCYDALAWVHANAARLGIDPDRLCVAGDSAGGNLAAVVALMTRDLGGPSLAMQLLIYPCTDMDTARWQSFTDNAEGYMLTTAMMEWFYDQYAHGEQRVEPYASPIRADDLSGVAPAVVAVAGFDPLCDEGAAYATALQRAGVSTTLVTYPGLFHGFAGMGAAIDKSREAVAMMGAALATATA